MRAAALLAASLAALTAAAGALAAGGPGVSADGVRLTTPAGWHRVASAGDGPVVDPRTLLVVGTAGVRPQPSQCQVAAYRIPASGAAVVVVGWKSATSGGGRLAPGRARLAGLRSVKRPGFECFRGRGAAAQIVLQGRAYQVNVLVGDRATDARVQAALAVARSLALVR